MSYDTRKTKIISLRKVTIVNDTIIAELYNDGMQLKC